MPGLPSWPAGLPTSNRATDPSRSEPTRRGCGRRALRSVCRRGHSGAPGIRQIEGKQGATASQLAPLGPDRCRRANGTERASESPASSDSGKRHTPRRKPRCSRSGLAAQFGRWPSPPNRGTRRWPADSDGSDPPPASDEPGGGPRARLPWTQGTAARWWMGGRCKPSPPVGPDVKQGTLVTLDGKFGSDRGSTPRGSM